MATAEISITPEMIAEAVRKAMESLAETNGTATTPTKPTTGKLDAKKDYPLGQKRPDLVRSATGLSIDEITLEKAASGKLTFDDVRIRPETLEYQAQIAESAGRPHLAKNLRRAAEMTRIPDARVLEIYNALRPYRSTKQELLDIASEAREQVPGEESAPTSFAKLLRSTKNAIASRSNFELPTMAYIAGVDVGNNTTEVALAEIDAKGNPRFLSSAMVRTVGIKGTLRNAMGIIEALDQALKPAGLRRDQLDAVLLNEATPVIGDIAMETITETVITESAMIGHNPSTPGGTGLGQGRTIALGELATSGNHQPYIAIVPGEVEFKDAADAINAARPAADRCRGNRPEGRWRPHQQPLAAADSDRRRSQVH